MTQTPIDIYGQKYINERNEVDPRERLLFKAEGRVKNAKMWLILVGAFTIILAVVYYFSIYHQTNLLATGIDAFVGAIFIALALWVDKKPRMATLFGLILYLIVVLVGILASPASFSTNIIIKILVVAALASGFRAAKQAEDLRNELNIMDQKNEADLPIDQL